MASLDALLDEVFTVQPKTPRSPEREPGSLDALLDEVFQGAGAMSPPPEPGWFSRAASGVGGALGHVFGQPPDVAEEAFPDLAAEAVAPVRDPALRRGYGVTGTWEAPVEPAGAAEAGVSPSELVAPAPPLRLPGPPVQPGAAAVVTPPPAVAPVPSQVEVMRQAPGAAVEGIAAPKIPWPDGIGEPIKAPLIPWNATDQEYERHVAEDRLAALSGPDAATARRLTQRSATMGAAGPDMQVEAARRLARPLPEESFQEAIASLRGLEASRRALNERTVSLNADLAELDRLRGAIEQAPTQLLIDAFNTKLATVKPAYEAMAKEAVAISNDAQRAFEAARRSGNRAGIAQAGGLYEWGVSTVQALASLGGSVGTGIQFAASLPGLAGQASTEIGRAQTFPIPGLVKPRPETPVEEMQRGSLEAREAETIAAKDSTEAWVRSRGEIISRYWDDVAKQFPSAYEGRHVVDEPSLLLDPIYLGKGVIQASISMAPSLIMAGGVIRGIQIGGRVLKLTDQLILDLARVGAAVSAGIGGGGLEGAQTYEEIRRRGGSHDQAAKGAILMGLAATGLNTLSFTKMFGRPGAGPFGRVKHVVGAGFTEAGTEALEEPSEALILGDNMLKALREEGVDVAVPAFITGGFAAGFGGQRAAGRGEAREVLPGIGVPPGAHRSVLALEAFLRQNDPRLTRGQTPEEIQESGRQAARKAMERERPQFVPAPETAGVPEPAPLAPPTPPTPAPAEMAPAAGTAAPAPSGALPTYITENRGRWFTPDERMARSHGGVVSFVDVPVDVADATRGEMSRANEHVLPDVWMSQARPIAEAGPLADGFVRLYRGEDKQAPAPPVAPAPPEAAEGEEEAPTEWVANYLAPDAVDVVRGAITAPDGSLLPTAADHVNTWIGYAEQAKAAAPDLADQINARVAELQALLNEVLHDQRRRLLEPPKPAKPTGTGEPFSTTLYQGRGKSREQIFGRLDGVSILGPAQYYALNERDAARYGAVTTHQVDLANPLVILSDREWFDLLRAADARQLSSVDKVPGSAEEAAQRLQDYIRSQGHDGLIARFPPANEADIGETGQNIKRLRESFGHSTVVKFPGPAAPAKPVAPPKVEPPVPAPPVAKPPAPPAPAAPVTPAVFTLPRDLAGAKPRFGYGGDNYTLDFESDLDKALFVVAQTFKNKRDADYMAALRTVYPDSEEQTIRDLGRAVKDRVKLLVKGQDAAQPVRVPTIMRAPAAKPAPPPAEPPAPPEPAKPPAKKPRVEEPFDPNDINHLIRFVRARGRIAPSPSGDLVGEYADVPAHFKSKRGLSPERMAEAIEEASGVKMSDAELLGRLKRYKHLQAQQAASQAADRRAQEAGVAAANLTEADLIRELAARLGITEDEARRIIEAGRPRVDEDAAAAKLVLDAAARIEDERGGFLSEDELVDAVAEETGRGPDEIRAILGQRETAAEALDADPVQLVIDGLEQPEGSPERARARDLMDFVEELVDASGGVEEARVAVDGLAEDAESATPGRRDVPAVRLTKDDQRALLEYAFPRDGAAGVSEEEGARAEGPAEGAGGAAGTAASAAGGEGEPGAPEGGAAARGPARDLARGSAPDTEADLLRRYRQTAANPIRIPGVVVPFIDTSLAGQPESLARLAETPHMRAVADALDVGMRILSTDLASIDTRYGGVRLAAIDLQNDVLGLNAPSPEGHGEIAVAPFAHAAYTSRRTGESDARYAERLSREMTETLAHELAHETNRTHGAVFQELVDRLSERAAHRDTVVGILHGVFSEGDYAYLRAFVRDAERAPNRSSLAGEGEAPGRKGPTGPNALPRRLSGAPGARERAGGAPEGEGGGLRSEAALGRGGGVVPGAERAAGEPGRGELPAAELGGGGPDVARRRFTSGRGPSQQALPGAETEVGRPGEAAQLPLGAEEPAKTVVAPAAPALPEIRRGLEFVFPQSHNPVVETVESVGRGVARLVDDYGRRRDFPAQELRERFGKGTALVYAGVVPAPARARILRDAVGAGHHIAPDDFRRVEVDGRPYYVGLTTWTRTPTVVVDDLGHLVSKSSIVGQVVERVKGSATPPFRTERTMPVRGIAVDAGLTAEDYAKATRFIPQDVLSGSGEEVGYVLGVRDALAGLQEPSDPNLGGAVQSAIYKGFVAARGGLKTERTTFGDQGLIPGAEKRAIPAGPLKATVRQKDIEETPLFGQKEEERRRESDEAQGRLFEPTTPYSAVPGRPELVGPTETFKYGEREPVDEAFYYHVTTAAAARRIIREGFVPGRRQTMAEGAYRDLARGKVFLTDRQGVAYWRDRIEEHLEHQYDNPPKLVVVRVSRDAVSVEPDPNRAWNEPASWVIAGELRRVEEPTTPYSALPPDEALIRRAERHYGVTENWREAGYVLPDGTMLDFSGRHYSSGYERKPGAIRSTPVRGQQDYLGGRRNVDHREDLSVVMPEFAPGDAAAPEGRRMRTFMDRTGAVRFHPSVPGLDFGAVPPTDAQLRVAIRAARETREPLVIDGPERQSWTFDRPTLDAVREALGETRRVEEPTTRYARRSDATEADDRGAQQAFDFLDQVASRPVSSLRGNVLGRGPTGVPRTLGVAFDVDQINKELRRTGTVNFRGRVIDSPEAYALAAQILRSPLFETARFHFTNAAGRVVHQESYTSRLPNSVEVFVTRDMAGEVRAMWARAQAQGATKAWVTHNHPTGAPKPSDADVDLTTLLAEYMPLQGHVVTDGKQYGFIEPDGTTSLRDVPGVTEDLLLRPAVPHRLLRRKIENAEDLAALGRELSVPESSAVAFQVGADQLVRVIQELPIADLVDLDKAVPYLKESRAVSGAVETLLWTTAKDPKLAWNGQFLVRQGAIADYGWTGGTAVVELLGQPGTAAMLEEAAQLRERPGPAIRVEEGLPPEPTRDQPRDEAGRFVAEQHVPYVPDAEARRRGGRLLEAVRALPDTAQASQILRALRAAGVSDQALQASGLQGFLKFREGQRVSRDALGHFLQAPESVVPDLAEVGRVLTAADYETWATKMAVLVGEWARPHLPAAWAHMRGETTPAGPPARGVIDAEAGTLREVEGLVTDAPAGAAVQIGDETFTRRADAVFPWAPGEEGDQPLSTPALLGRIRDRRASLGYAPGPAAPPVAAPGTAPPATGPGSPASFKLMSRIAEIMDIPVRVGRMRQGRSVLGIFKAPPPVPGGKIPDVIRLRTAEDIQTLAHEVGHYVSRLLWGSQWPGRRPSPRQLARRAFYRTHEAELMALAVTHRKPSAEEGFAEFWRLYLTREAQARTSAPVLYGVLETEVGRHDPDLLAALRNIRDWYVAWRSMEPSERVRAHIMSSREVDREREDARLDMFSIVEQAMDRYARVVTATEAMTKGAALPAERDPRVLIRALSGAPRLVDLFLFKGRTNLPEVFVKMFGASKGGGGALDFATRRRAGPSLEEALEPVRARVDDWKVYMIARRVQELFRRPDDRAVRQRESLMRAWEMQESDVDGIVAKYDGPEFRQAHDTYQEWNRAVLAFVRDSGLLAGEVTVRDPAGGPSRTMSLYDLITDLNQSHFPFHRFFEERAEIGVPAGGKLTNVQQPVRAMKGSGRLFLDPLDTAVRNLYVMVMSAERHAVVRAFVDLAERTEGGGRWFERVPPESRATSFPVEEIRRQLEAAGVDPAALNNADLEAVLRVFRPDAYKTRENEEWVIGPNGRPVHYIVEPNLHRALTGMNVGDVSLLDGALSQLPAPGFRQLLSIFREGEVGEGLKGTLLNRKLWEAFLFGPARLRRAGATLAPEFQGRNVLRDTFDRAMLSQVTAKGKVPVVWPFADMVRAIVGVPKGLLSAIRHDEWYEARLRGGGEIASLPSLDLYDIQRRIDDVLTGRDGADWHTVYHPIQLARLIAATLEDVNRIAETRDVLEARGQRGTTASKSEMLVGGTASREGTVDFNMIGAMTKRLAINRLAAFFNANIQGNYRTYRAFRADPGRMAWFAFMTITLPSLLLWWAEHDDPRWAEIPQWQKDNSWIYLTGAVTEAQYAKMSKDQRRALMRQTVWRVPKPWLPGVVFGSVPERILDWAYGHTPRTLVESLTQTLGVAASMSLIPTPTMLEPILDNMADYMSFFGRPIEGRGMKEKEAGYRVRPHTSRVARWIAGGFDAANEVARSTAGTRPVPEMLRSPLQVDHLLQSLGGGLERLGAEVVDWTVDFFDKNAPPKPERTWADIPGIRAFAVRFPTTQSESIDKFYDIYTDAQQAVNTYRPMVGPKKPKAGAPPIPERLAEQAEGYERRRAALLLVAPALAKVAETLGERRKGIQAIYDDKTKAPSIKRAEIEELVMDMIEAASDGVRQARDVERAVAAGARGGP